MPEETQADIPAPVPGEAGAWKHNMNGPGKPTSRPIFNSSWSWSADGQRLKVVVTGGGKGSQRTNELVVDWGD